MMWRRAVSLVNGRVHTEHGEARALRFSSRVLGLDEPPRRGDTVIDLDGAMVLPGLVNAHDHLELNHYGRLKFRDQYANVSEWIDDMRPRLSSDPRVATGRAHALADRLFVGVLKNLLAGVTLVAHHNPFYRELGATLPIKVLRRYGWAHSFQLERAASGARGELGGEVAARHKTTPREVPFFVHMAEGVDAEAGQELHRLEALGCLHANVVLVHGVAMTPADWARVSGSGAGLVWCPGSNQFLFNRTARIREFLDSPAGAGRNRIALGTDSRLSGQNDLLEEARAAAATGAASPREILHMVTSAGGALLRQRAGRLERGAPADLIVIPNGDQDPGRALLATRRSDVGLVVVDGQPKVGQRSFAAVFEARRVHAGSLRVDDTNVLADRAIVRRMAGCAIQEPGVEAA
jgi:cytosine/adenosine deaminase-related metal-dependent hydrolase